MSARNTGILWENAALAHLRRAGLEPLTRNFNCRFGEIDLVMRDKGGHGSIVFVEVRYRNDEARGDGTASVGAGKRAKLVRAAALYLQSHPVLAREPCRFDVIGCSGTPEQPQFDWTRNAFDAEN
jgi:putative endonuclease